MFKTESEVIAILETAARVYHPNVKVRTGRSSQTSRGLNRDVVFFLIVPISVNRDDIIKSLNLLSLKYDRELYFSGSEAGMLYGDIENDWLFITAQIMGV